jgi:hypothetical protein
MGRILRHVVVLAVLGLVAYGVYVTLGGDSGTAPRTEPGIVYVDPNIGAR